MDSARSSKANRPFVSHAVVHILRIDRSRRHERENRGHTSITRAFIQTKIPIQNSEARTNRGDEVRLCDLVFAQLSIQVRGDPDRPERTAFRENVLRVKHPRLQRVVRLGFTSVAVLGSV